MMTDDNGGKGYAEPGEIDDGGGREGGSLPEVDFITFLLSLNHSAACHLGHAPNPETKTCREDLPLVKQTIDILAMLQSKTQGNLTGEEERLLSEILFDLRLAYVKIAKKG